MNKELWQHLDLIHTTKLGEERIKKNLKIHADVVEYLKDKIENKNAVIYQKGKNYYVEIDDFRITINSHNYCIITAHFINKCL